MAAHRAVPPEPDLAQFLNDLLLLLPLLMLAAMVPLAAFSH